MSRVSSSSMTILINGTKTDYFNPSWGIRQGDPLSPYLFILCMKMLSDNINYQVDMGLLNPIKISARGPYF